MIKTLLMDPKDQEKISVYSQLLSLPPDTYNYYFLSRCLNLPYSRVVSLVGELNRDLFKVNTEHISLLTDHQKIKLTDELPSEESLSIHLMQQDIPFLFLVEVIENRYDSLDDFAYSNHTSPATVRRKLKPLSAFLSDYQLSIKFSSLEIVGSERMIRTILCCLLWLSSKGKELPFSHFSLEEANKKVKEYLLLTPQNEDILILKHQRKLDADVSYYRIANQHFIEETDYVIPPSTKLLQNETLWGRELGAPLEYQSNETSYMTFRLFFGPVFYKCYDPALFVVMDMVANGSPMLHDFTVSLKQFIHEIVLKDADKTLRETNEFNLLLGNLTIIFYSYLVYKSKIPYTFLMNKELIENKSLIYLDLFEKVQRFFEKFAYDYQLNWLTDCIEELCQIFTTMLLPDYERLATEYHLTVTCIFEDHFIYNQKISKYLSSLTYINYLDFQTASLDQADVIITSNKGFKNKYPEISSIFFPPTVDKKKYFELENKLIDYYLKKITIQ